MDSTIKDFKDIEKNGREIQDIAKTAIKLQNAQKIEKNQGHASRWLQQAEGAQPVKLEEELVYDPKTCNDFLKRVFLIVLLMLLVTFVFVLIVGTVDSITRKFQRSGYFITIYSVITLLGINYFWLCSWWSRMAPYNYLALGLSVVAMSCLISAVSFTYFSPILFYPHVGTIVAVFICLLLSSTSFNFNRCCLYMLVFPFALAPVGCLLFYDLYVRVAIESHTALYTVGTTFLVVFILLMQLQMLLSGTSVLINENDHPLTAWLLYASSVVFIVQLVQTFDVIDTE